jgi:transketolase
VADRSKFADTDLKAAAKGLLRDSRFRARQAAPRLRVAQGSSSTVNLVKHAAEAGRSRDQREGDRRDQRGIVRPPAEAYRNSVLPPEAYYDLMVVSTGTRRVWPLRDVGPLTDEYSLTSDWDNQWLTGGWKRK